MSVYAFVDRQKTTYGFAAGALAFLICPWAIFVNGDLGWNLSSFLE